VKPDVISVVESAYRLDLGTKEWLSHLLARAAPYLDRGMGLAATVYRLDRGPEESTVVSHAMDARTLNALLLASRGDEDSHRIVGSKLPFGTTTQRLERLGFTKSEARSHRNFVNLFRPLGVLDVLAMSASEPTGLAVLVVAPQRDARRPTRGEAARWARVATHIGAGARLRGTTTGVPRTDADAAAEAILSPSGMVMHAEVAAKPAHVRDRLREAVRALDRARSRERQEADRALDLWQGLVSGRWSLVDRFDTDGRRFIVARKNDPDVRDPRALTRRERQVLAYTVLGRSLKEAAYALGLSVPTISIHRARAMRKLGLRSQADVARLLSQGAPP
jgi:DNA-binding CsgD family transcriptional regulator